MRDHEEDMLGNNLELVDIDSQFKFKINDLKHKHFFLSELNFQSELKYSTEAYCFFNLGIGVEEVGQLGKVCREHITIRSTAQELAGDSSWMGDLGRGKGRDH